MTGEVQTTLDIELTGTVDLTEQLMAVAGQLLGNTNFWMFLLAMLSTLIIMQGVKAVVRKLIGHRNTHRRWTTFVMAFFVGFGTCFVFIDSDWVYQWAVLNGLLNPTIFWVLLQYARVRKKVIMESVLRMRPPVEDENGKWSVDDTQTFMAKKFDAK